MALIQLAEKVRTVVRDYFDASNYVIGEPNFDQKIRQPEKIQEAKAASRAARLESKAHKAEQAGKPLPKKVPVGFDAAKGVANWANHPRKSADPAKATPIPLNKARDYSAPDQYAALVHESLQIDVLSRPDKHQNGYSLEDEGATQDPFRQLPYTTSEYRTKKQALADTVSSVPKPQRKPIPRQTEMGSRRALFALIALSIGGFGIGTTEFVSMGLLKYIGADYGISDSDAGRIITAYALGVVVGAPLITALTGRIPRRRLLLLLMGAFTIGNGLSVIAPNYPTLLTARFIAGIPHGAFFGVCSLVAVSLAKPGKRGQAIAVVNLGLPIATLVGVPMAQAIGQAMSWHAAYAMVAMIGVITFISLWVCLPHMNLMLSTNPATELGALIKPQVLLTLLMGTVGFGGMFAVYTYISWTMTEVAGLPADLMWLVLMAYGVGMIIGTWVGGLMVDRGAERGIFIALVIMIVVLSAFYFTSHNPWLGTINFAMVGMSGSLLVPNLQTRLMDTAGDAQTLAAAMNQSALNLANAGGALVGGWVLSSGHSYSSGGLVGAAMAVGAMIIWAPTALARAKSGSTSHSQPVHEVKAREKVAA